ncbi:MAG: LysR substrate-binding domain-containing protein [Pseudomonadota bacterium]|nr:LysR substrate-binding domain-containing protein [Pseudomonadota bacterium]
MSKINEFAAMQVFVQVVKAGSFSGAARDLGSTPSGVSRQMSQLEEALGNLLFQRTTRTQRLTEAGQLYFRHAEKMLSDMAVTKHKLSQLSNRPSGDIRVSVEADFASACLAPLLPEFLALYPDIHLQIHMSSDRVNLVNDDMDLAIRLGHLEDSSLKARKLGEGQSVLCASPQYLAQRGLIQHPSELEQHNCLSFRVRPGRRVWTFQNGVQEIDVKVEGNLQVNSVSMLRMLAVQSVGVILVPEWAVSDDLEQRKLVTVLDKYPVIPRGLPIHAVFTENRQMPAKVRVLVDYLVSKMAT